MASTSSGSAPSSAPAQKVTVQKTGFWPVVLGGVVAAGLGSAATIWALPNLPAGWLPDQPAPAAAPAAAPEVDVAAIRSDAVAAAQSATAEQIDALRAELAAQAEQGGALRLYLADEREHDVLPEAGTLALFMSDADTRGWEVVPSRGVHRRDVRPVRSVPQMAGWRHFPEAKGRRPFWPIPGSIKAARTRAGLDEWAEG